MTTTAFGEYRSQFNSVSAGYTSRNFTERKNADFYGDLSAAAAKTTADNHSRVIGLTTIPYSPMLSYGMKARYAPESTRDNPIIQVTSNYEGETISYNVNVNEVNPENASQLEMFALLSYADDSGISKGGTFGSYQQMKTYSYNACSSGYIAGYSESTFFSYETFIADKFNWSGIISAMMEDYLSAGIYDQSQNCKNLLNAFGRFGAEKDKNVDENIEANSANGAGGVDSADGANSTESGKEKTTADYIQLIRNKISEMYDKVMNNETEESFQIGASSFTEKEWSKLLEEFDDIQETIRELMREEHKKRQAKQAEREERVDKLVSEALLDSNALFSICHVPTGETANIYKAADFSENNPVYVVKGIDENGNEYEQRIDASNVNPTSCSYTEMLVWGVHSGNTSPKDYLAMARMRSESGSNSYQTTTNYLEIIQKLMGEMQSIGDMEHYLNYKKWFEELTK